MNNIIKRLQRLVDALAGGKYTVFARNCSIPISTFKTYLDGQSSPKAEHLIKIYAHYGINLNWLLTGEGHHRIWGNLGEEGIEKCLSPEDYVLLPLLKSGVTAGPEGELVYEQVNDYYPFKRHWIDNFATNNDHLKSLYLIRVQGHSMSPTINDGEMVLFDTFESVRLQIQNGKIYLIIQPDGGVSIKRLVLIPNTHASKLLCLSDNPSFRPFEILIEEEKTLKNYILGCVRWAGKELD